MLYWLVAVSQEQQLTLTKIKKNIFKAVREIGFFFVLKKEQKHEYLIITI